LRTIAANGMIHAGCGRGSPEAITEEELAPLLIRLRDRAEELSLRLLWYTPTAYCRFSPLELELGPRRCNAGEYSICVEPNGDVLPCQSYYEPVGNLLRDPWDAIWNSPLFERFRRRTVDPRGCGLPEPCWDCPDLAVCGGGCPLERQSRSHAEPRRPRESVERSTVA
jgi:radical SAM protein with 4Fe4S-binding SPASM domain